MPLGGRLRLLEFSDILDVYEMMFFRRAKSSEARNELRKFLRFRKSSGDRNVSQQLEACRAYFTVNDKEKNSWRMHIKGLEVTSPSPDTLPNTFLKRGFT
jgi:hypothetical protein